MRILLLFPPIRESDNPRNFPHGIGMIAAVLRNAGHQVRVLDINGNRWPKKEVVKKIKEEMFEVVGIGGLITVYGYLKWLVPILKGINPSAPIIIGGSLGCSIPDIVLGKNDIDIVVDGEGEITIVKLIGVLENKRDLSTVKGIYFKDNGKIVKTPPRELIKNLDELPFPAYDLFPMEIYLSNPVVGIGRDLDLISSRGCPYHCTFCYRVFGNRYRFHSPDYIIKEIKFLKKRYDIDFISFQDDEFMANRRRIYEFCEKRNRFFPDLLWSCTGRANIVAHDEEIVKMMRDSGCTLISFGFESGSQRMLDSMNKMQTIEMMEKTLKICRKYGLPVPVSFIIGMPGEDEKSCEETVHFCIRNNIPLDSLMFATPYPGSEIFNFALRTKRIDKNNINEFLMKLGDARDFTINLTDYFTDEELINKRKEMMEITKENYRKFITEQEIKEKMRNLFGGLMDRIHLDEKDLEHRLIHGGISIF